MNVNIPVPVRVTAYIATLLPFAALSTWLTAVGHLSPATAVLAGAVVSCVHTVAGALALSHLTLPDTSDLNPAALDPSAVDVAPPVPAVAPAVPVTAPAAVAAVPVTPGAPAGVGHAAPPAATL